MMLWFSVMVPLGKRTLVGHLRAIAATPAAHDLADGTEEEARKVSERLRQELGHDGGTRATSAPEPLEPSDRRALDDLVRERRARPAREPR